MHGSFLLELIGFFNTGSYVVDTSNLVLFKTLFCSSLLLKHGVEISRKYPSHVARGTFQHWAYIRPSKFNSIFELVYHFSFHLRPLAIFLLLSPQGGVIGASFLSLSFFAETRCLSRFHTMYSLIILLVMALDAQIARAPNIYSFYFSENSIDLSTDAVGVIYIKTLLIVMYLSGFRRKIQYKFWDGKMLKEASIFSLSSKGRRFRDHLGAKNKAWLRYILPRYSKQLSKLTIVLQILVPALLLAPAPFTYIAIFLGTIKHLSITLLFPITLGFFTLMVLATFCLWL